MRNEKITRAAERKERIKMGFGHYTGRKQAVNQKYKQYVPKIPINLSFNCQQSSTVFFPLLPELPKKEASM